jgi:type II secretory pathway pseudopilin PulG
MAALLVALAVIGVLSSMAMPVWSHATKREKESELIWRGEQYARAIGLYQRKFPGAFPPTLDVLVQQKFLRKKYKDPITGDDFQLLRGTPGIVPGRPAGTLGGEDGDEPVPGRPPRRPTAPSGAAGGFGGSGQAGGGAIVGVTSKSDAKSIRLYKGRDKYRDWLFVYTQPTTAAGTPGTVAPGGLPGRPGGPGRPPGGFGRPGQGPGGFGRPGVRPPGSPPRPQPPSFDPPEEP